MVKTRGQAGNRKFLARSVDKATKDGRGGPSPSLNGDSAAGTVAVERSKKSGFMAGQSW